MVTELELSIYLDMRIPEFSPELFYRSSNLSYDHTRRKRRKNTERKKYTLEEINIINKKNNEGFFGNFFLDKLYMAIITLKKLSLNQLRFGIVFNSI